MLSNSEENHHGNGLWIVAVILVIAGIFAIIRKQFLPGVVDAEWITEN